MPEVSVIVPCYNQGQYLADALKSLLAQTFENWEAILIDDGSTDDTRAVAARFADPRIRYLYQENGGLSAARNSGLRQAQGLVIALLDADDMWQPRFLERMVETLNAHPEAGAAYCGFRYMDASGVPLRQLVCKVVPPERFYRELIEQGSWLCACSVVARRSMYRAVGPFDETLRAYEDFDMWCRMAGEHPFAGVPEVLVLYRRGGKNMSDDPERMTHAFSQVIEKLVGPLAGPVGSWPVEKRALACQLHIRGLQGYLARGHVVESAADLAWLAEHDFDQVNTLSIWYTLACVHQPVGQRGDFETWQPERGEADVLALLQQAIQLGINKQQIQAMRGQAHLALAFLNYAKGRMPAARRHLARSVAHAPRLVVDGAFWRFAVRLVPGVTFLRAVKNTRAAR